MTAGGSDAWLGIDLGTQGVRVVVAASDGTVLGEGSCPLTSRREDDRHEQHPEQWWRAILTAIDLARAAGADLRRVQGWPSTRPPAPSPCWTTGASV